MLVSLTKNRFNQSILFFISKLLQELKNEQHKRHFPGLPLVYKIDWILFCYNVFVHFLPGIWYCIEPRESLINREEQTDSTRVYKYYFIWTKEGVRSYSKFEL